MPLFDDIMIQHIYHNNNVIISKIEAGIPLSVLEHEDALRLPKNYLLCFLHGYSDVVQQLKKAKDYITKYRETEERAIPMLEVYNKSFMDGLSPSKWQTTIYTAVQSKNNPVPEAAPINESLEATELEQQ